MKSILACMLSTVLLIHAVNGRTLTEVDKLGDNTTKPTEKKTFTEEVITSCDLDGKEVISCPKYSEIRLMHVIRGHEKGSRKCNAPASTCRKGSTMVDPALACGDETCGVSFTNKYKAFCDTHQVCKILRKNTSIKSRKPDIPGDAPVCSDAALDNQTFGLTIGFRCLFGCVIEQNGWHPWGDCSKECDGGERTRDRIVVQHAHPDAKFQCDKYEMKQTEKCNEDPCDCEVTEWEEWGSCSKSCGDGEKKRKRKVKTPGKKSCKKSLEETAQCKEKECASDTPPPTPKDSKDSAFSTVSSWGLVCTMMFVVHQTCFAI
eukprot:Filipodium_phascolosomae@DN431_c0_g1_i1.p1